MSWGGRDRGRDRDRSNRCAAGYSSQGSQFLIQNSEAQKKPIKSSLYEIMKTTRESFVIASQV